MSQKYIKFRIQKRRRRASVSCLRGPPTVSLCGDWLWRGQACRQPRKCQRNQPDSSSASRGHVTCLGLTAIICQTVRITTLFSFPPIPPPPHPPPFFFSPPSGWNVSTHFSLYALCLTDVGERSLWWCCAGEMSRNVRELLMSCNSEKHLCVGMTFKNLSSCKISQNVCTSLFLQIIYSNYLRSVCPNIHISIFVWRFQIVKNVRFEPQLQANSPKPFVLFFSLQSVKSGFVGHLGQSRSWLTPQFANIIKCFDWSVSVQVDIKVWVTSAVWNKLSIEKETWAQKYILSLFNPFSQWK